MTLQDPAPKDVKSSKPAESKPIESSKHTSSRTILVQKLEDLPEGRSEWGPAFPGTSADESPAEESPADESPADESPEGLFPSPADADNDSSEPLLQDLFAGLEQRAALGGVDDATSCTGANPVR